MSDAETAYLLARARDEAIAAIRAENPAVSAVHQRLSMLYSAKAIIELGHDETGHRPVEHPSPIAAAWR
jgi:hypothetical protein